MARNPTTTPAVTLRSPATWAGPDRAERQIVDAALACIARVGIAKTTVDDVAAEAGCSRATLYRHVRGKRQLLAAVVRSEVARVLAIIDAELEEANDLESALTAGIVAAAREFEAHDALQFVFRHEPELVLPHISFAAADRVLAAAATCLGPRLERFVSTAEASRVGEWVARIFLSYSCNPSPAVLLTDRQHVRRLVHDFVLPGIITAFAPARGSQH